MGGEREEGMQLGLSERVSNSVYNCSIRSVWLLVILSVYRRLLL